MSDRFEDEPGLPTPRGYTYEAPVDNAEFNEFTGLLNRLYGDILAPDPLTARALFDMTDSTQYSEMSDTYRKLQAEIGDPFFDRFPTLSSFTVSVSEKTELAVFLATESDFQSQTGITTEAVIEKFAKRFIGTYGREAELLYLGLTAMQTSTKTLLSSTSYGDFVKKQITDLIATDLSTRTKGMPIHESRKAQVGQKVVNYVYETSPLEDDIERVAARSTLSLIKFVIE